MLKALDLYKILFAVGLIGLAGPAALRAQQALNLEDIEIPEGDECATCHIDIEELPHDFAPYDVHFEAGLTCAGCHGGDPTSDDEDVAMSKAAGFVGVPERSEIPAFCGKCHSNPAYMRTFQPRIRTDQEAQYHTSGHGMALANGDTKVAECASCHTAHAILPASDARAPIYALNVPETCNKCHGDDEYMAGYSLERNVFKKYAASVHGIALLEQEDVGAPACNDCHGNHGALPPEVASLAEVCGTCHPNNQRLFEHSPMAGPFVENDLNACIACHNHHGIEKPTDEMVGTGDAAICMDCHSEGDDGYAVADSVHHYLTSLVALTDSATALRQEVVRVGMDDVDIGFMLLDAHQSLVQSRTLVHGFKTDLVRDETGKGVANAQQAIALAHHQIEEHSNRRQGFALAALFATLLLLALYLKLRDIERNGNAAKANRETT